MDKEKFITFQGGWRIFGLWAAAAASSEGIRHETIIPAIIAVALIGSANAVVEIYGNIKFDEKNSYEKS